MIAYPFRRALYLNLTDRCPTACVFCVKNKWNSRFRGQDLSFPHGEPSTREILREFRAGIQTNMPREVVFCGYGECTYRLPDMLRIAARIRGDFPDVPLRLNTIGLGNLIWGREIVQELSESLDAVSVSLNTADPGQWQKLHRPEERFRERGYASVTEFIHGCVRAGLRTTVTAVDLPGVALDAVARLARALGAGFRLRPRL